MTDSVIIIGSSDEEDVVEIGKNFMMNIFRFICVTRCNKSLF